MKKNIVLNRDLRGVPKGTEFKRVRKSATDIRWYPVERGILFPDGSAFFLTDGFVQGDFPADVKPRCWYPGMFTDTEPLKLVA